MLGTLAGQDIDKFIERVTVIIWLLAGGMLSHMKFVGFSCRDKRLTVCVKRLERFFIEARRYYLSASSNSSDIICLIAASDNVAL